MLQTIPGDAGTLSAGAASMAETAQLLLALSSDLDRIAARGASIGDAADAIRMRTEEAAATVRTAEPRYAETSAAIREFAVVLLDVQSRHRAANADADAAADQMSARLIEIDDLDQLARQAVLTSPDAEQAADLALRRRWLTGELDDARSRVREAESRALAAEEEWETAVEAAADRIDPVLAALDDSFLDRVGAAIEDLGGFLAAVGEWIAKILDTVITALLLVVMAVVAIVVVLALVLSSYGVFLLVLLANGASLDDVVEMLVGIALVVVPILTGVVAALLLREVLTPTPAVTADLPAGGTLVKRDGKAPYEYLFDNDGFLDAEGGTDSTVIDIVQVMNPDGTPALDENGNPIWRVTLPSTMDWQLTGDHGAVNDLGSNLALILSPQQKAAYERAVLQAMHDAGIAPDDPVMLIGWSQGGILAGAIASDPQSGFNVRALSVAGAPIDHMPIPPTVSVLALQHDGDHVPRLDGVAPHQGPGWVTVNTPSAGSGYPHNIADYADTAREQTTGPAVRPDVQRIIDAQSKFFSGTEISRTFSFQEPETALR